MIYVTCLECGKKNHISTWKIEKKISGNEAVMTCPCCGRKATVKV